MAWFELKAQPRRALRKGICLRIRNIPEPLAAQILSFLPNIGLYSGDLKGGQIQSVIIDGLLSDGKVRLEVWSETHEDRVRSNNTIGTVSKFTVLHLVVPENEDWVCESDQGRGLVKGKK